MSRRVGTNILDWNEDYEVKFFGEPTDNRYYGVELEIDGGNIDRLGRLLNGNASLDDTIYLVEDGSLIDGVEIVTNPMSLEYHKKTDLWGNLTQYARVSNYNSHDTGTCGLHVHVSRKALSQDIIDNILFLNERFWERWVKFSRRKPEEMERWANKLTNFNVSNVTKKGVKESADTRKYNAINIENEHTLEFRIFKGTLKVSTIFATLDMVDHIINVAQKYAEDDTLNIDDITWSTFLEDITSDDLINYLERRELSVKDVAEEDEQESKERKKEIKKSIAQEIKSLTTSILNPSEYDEDLSEHDDALIQYLQGDTMVLERISTTFNYGDEFVLTDVSENRFGGGDLSNIREVLRYDGDTESHRGGMVDNRIGYYFYSDSVAKLIKINKTSLYDGLGGFQGEYNHVFLFKSGNIALVNYSKAPHAGYPLVTSTSLIEEGYSIKINKGVDMIKIASVVGRGELIMIRELDTMSLDIIESFPRFHLNILKERLSTAINLVKEISSGESVRYVTDNVVERVIQRETSTPVFFFRRK